MKKRPKVFLLNLLLTLGLTALAWPLYMQPIEVSFDVSTSRETEFSVLWTTRAKQAFRPRRMVTEQIPLAATPRHISFYLPAWRISRLRLDFGEHPGPIRLENISVSGSKTLRLAADKFSAAQQVSLLLIPAGKLEISSAKETPSVIYQEPLNILRQTDWNLLVSLAGLIFLILYKPLVYFSRLKALEKYSRLDILFVVCFFLLLCVPALKISDDVISEQENRTLARYRPLMRENRFNYSYGTDFNSWFSDHFFDRKYLINALTRLNYAFNNQIENAHAVLGQDGWMFAKGAMSLFTALTQEQLESYGQKLLRLQRYADKQDIRLYVVFAPAKEDIYRQYNPLQADYNNEQVLQLTRYMKERHGFPIYYLRDSIFRHKDDKLLFFKSDNHWTEDGAYLAYRDLIRLLQEDFPQISALPRSDLHPVYDKRVSFEFDGSFSAGGLTALLGLNERVLSEKYAYYQNIHKNELQEETDRAIWTKKFSYPGGADKSILVLGDSMGEQLMKFLPYSFRRSMRIRSNYQEFFTRDQLLMSRFEKQIEAFQPDILVVLIYAPTVVILDTLYKD